MKWFQYSIYILLIFSCSLAYTQKYDNTWLFGSGTNNDPNDGNLSGISILDFNIDTVQVYEEYDISMDFDEVNISISDINGNLLFYSNGESIENAAFQTIENGTNFNQSELSSFKNMPQAMLMLPFPDKENEYIIFYTEQGWIDIPGWTIEAVGLYYSIINMEQNNGLGAVTLKREPLVVDTLQYGKLTATKHANGRDWWMLINESHTNRFYTILISPDGVEVVGSQTVGLSSDVEGLGQAVFSPDGQSYVTFSAIDENIGAFLQIYDFDRCTGELSHQRLLNYNDEGAGGIAISANSRYLYVPSYNYIYQFDLWAEDIFATQDTVAIYDGFQSPFGSKFFLAQLAPNGKIYINSPNSENVLHVIHNPDEPGDACNVEQHGVQLPTYNAFTMPNFPNYRLGKLEGSPCDTIVSSTSRPVVDVGKVKVYPNPAKDILYVEFKEPINSPLNFQILDIYGRTIRTETIYQPGQLFDINTHLLINGLYVLKMQLPSGKTISQSFVIARQ